MAGLSASKSVQESAQYTAVSDFVSGKTASVDDALDQFAKPIEDKAELISEDDLEESLILSWNSVIAAAAETPFTDAGSNKLVDFILELGSRPDVQGKGQTRLVQDMAIWKDLPIFGWQMRDAWNFAAKDEDEESTRQKWINLNAWTASLVAAVHSNNNDKPDFSLYGIWTLRSALEESSAPSNTALAAAAVWIIFAAPALHDLSVKEKSYQGKFAAPGSALADQEWRGYSLSRWETWSKKLSEHQSQASDKLTQQLVLQAQDALKKVSTK